MFKKFCDKFLDAGLFWGFVGIVIYFMVKIFCNLELKFKIMYCISLIGCYSSCVLFNNKNSKQKRWIALLAYFSSIFLCIFIDYYV